MSIEDSINKAINRISTEQGRRVIVILLLLMLLAVTAQWLDSLWQTRPGVVIPSQRKIKVAVKAMPDIAAWHLFGVYQAVVLPITRLELTLEGVFFFADQQLSRALISAAGAPAKLYHIGQMLPGGATIDKIMHNKVILKHQGRLEGLPLRRPVLQFAPEPKNIFVQPTKGL